MNPPPDPIDREIEELAAEIDLVLVGAGDGVPPRAGLKEELMRRIESDEVDAPWKRWVEPRGGAMLAEGLRTLGAGEGDWEPTAIDGISARSLHVDPLRRRVTMLVRMEAGTAYPAHRHASEEECYVLSGELEVAGRTLRAGDYQHAEAGSLHGVQSTASGCTLLLVSSQDDELCA